jgi:hypothetical protein
MDQKTLVDEIERYLAAVEVFRIQGCEPRWRPERATDPPARLDATPLSVP